MMGVCVQHVRRFVGWGRLPLDSAPRTRMWRVYRAGGSLLGRRGVEETTACGNGVRPVCTACSVSSCIGFGAYTTAGSCEHTCLLGYSAVSEMCTVCEEPAGFDAFTAAGSCDHM